ncbi:DHA2 family efflux MFS transporter permease subunit [Pseudoalteromonas sp. MMG022]|uniref:DHA2 family efflux MFS transporter permease subunit n=1 Tax=Pseudoalteromonas sp. MMG022 TaxID=2909978 RepID=UPI001F00BEB4|nr:DHA2 family efflux MFS transporter permease subunit [Pseudoalteromonas sp. MMG022]MCF6436493.1 DHA2 family efflux MFS transporter permease subunit [Pseudoalteromonas sp. MMG022]
MMQNYLKIFAVYLVIFTQMLDTSIANLALVKIAPDLGIMVYNAAWIITAFGAGLVISFPLTSALSRCYCNDLLFVLASVVVILSSLGCGFAFSDVDFIIFRFLQGLSSGFLIVLSQSILFKIMGEDKRAMAVALWSSAISLAPIVGPVIGGFVIQYFSWRWLFLINFPLMIVCLIFLVDELEPKLKKNDGSSKVNYAALIAFAVAIASIQYVLDFGEKLNWFSNIGILLCTVTFVVGMILFYFFNKRNGLEVFDFAVFKDGNFSAAMAVMVVGNGLIFASLIVLPIWLQMNYKMPAMNAGIVVAIGSAVAGLLSPFVGKYVRKEWYFFTALVSLILTGISFFMMSQYTLDATFSQLASARVVAGLGIVLFATPLTAMSLLSITSDKVINANSISMCLRITSSNVFIALGFIQLQSQQHYTYESLLSNIQRPFIDAHFDHAFEYGSYLSDLVATLAMSNIFRSSGVTFFILVVVLLLTRYYLNSTRKVSEKEVVEKA